MYSIRIGARDMATVRFPRRELKPGDTWDMGVIALMPPEILTVRYHFAAGGGFQPRPVFDLIDAQGPWATDGFEAAAGYSAKTRTGVAPARTHYRSPAVSPPRRRSP